MAIYGRKVYITTTKTGTVTLTTPAHGTLASSISSGIVGESVTITSSMQTNYYISKYYVNDTAINGNTFKLVEGSNVVTCDEYYQQPSSGGSGTRYYTLTTEYYINSVLDSSLTKTYPISAYSYVRPSVYAKEINQATYSYCEPLNEFIMVNNTTIKYYYDKEIIPTLSNVTITRNQSAGSVSFTNNNEVPITIQFDTIQYYTNGEYKTATSSNMTLESGASDTLSLSTPLDYVYLYLVNTKDTNDKRPFTSGTIPTRLLSPTITVSSGYPYKTSSNLYIHKFNVSNSNSTSVTFSFVSSESSTQRTRSISANSSVDIEFTNTVISCSIVGYFTKSGYITSFDSDCTSVYVDPTTYYTLRVYRTAPTGTSTLYDTYQIASGTTIKPSDYTPPTPDGWRLDTYAPSSSFIMARDREIYFSYRYEDENVLHWDDFNVYASVDYNAEQGYSELSVRVSGLTDLAQSKSIGIAEGTVSSSAGQFQIYRVSAVGSVASEYYQVSGSYTWDAYIEITDLGGKWFSGSGTANN